MIDCIYLLLAYIVGGLVGFFICAFFVGANQHRFEHHGSTSFPIPKQPEDRKPSVPR